jgi:hypothetical protein
MGAIFAIVAAPHCTGCTGDFDPFEAIDSEKSDVDPHAESLRCTPAICALGAGNYLKRSFAGASGTIGDSGISPFHASLIAGITRSMASCET